MQLSDMPSKLVLAFASAGIKNTIPVPSQKISQVDQSFRYKLDKRSKIIIVENLLKLNHCAKFRLSNSAIHSEG